MYLYRRKVWILYLDKERAVELEWSGDSEWKLMFLKIIKERMS